MEKNDPDFLNAEFIDQIRWVKKQTLLEWDKAQVYMEDGRLATYGNQLITDYSMLFWHTMRKLL